jgi:hypothetical protein
MKAEPQDLELHRLFAAKADGTITPEEHEQLCAKLKESAEVRARWFAFQDVEDGVLAWAQRESQRLVQGPAALVSEGARELETKWGRGRRLRAWAAPLAAGIVLGGIIWALGPLSSKRMAHSGSNVAGREEATTSSVAVLTRGLNLAWDPSGGAPSLNAPLSPGWFRLKEGVAEIEFFQGARLWVEGPAEIELKSAGEAFCTRGRFSVHVPPHARGFRLGTPKGDIVDLGTEFGLDLTSATPELHVFKGEVELYQPKMTKRTLTEGQAAGLETPGSPRQIEPNAATFSFSRNFDERLLASQREAFAHWQSAGEAWNADPGLRVRMDFQDGDGSRSLHNAAANGQDIAPGTIVGCNWTQGRWPGKRALQFHSVSDRVRLNVPGAYKQFTLAAWVELDSVNPRRSSIFMCEGWEPGDAHWQILHDGSICLGIANTDRTIPGDYISPVVFTPDRLGQWVHLAVVYDAVVGEVRHYANGLRISKQHIDRVVTVTPGLAELGNWNPAPEWAHRPVRNLVGAIDDFSFCARALSDAEIKKLAE